MWQCLRVLLVICVFVHENLSQRWKYSHYISEREALSDTDHQQSLRLLTVAVLWETYLAKVFFHMRKLLSWTHKINKIQDIYLKRAYLRESNANWSVPYYGEYSAGLNCGSVFWHQGVWHLTQCKPITQIWLQHILLKVLFMSLFLVRPIYVIMPHHFSHQHFCDLRFPRHISKILYCSDKTHCRPNEQKKYL